MKVISIILASVLAPSMNIVFAETVEDAEKAIQECNLQPGVKLRGHGTMIYSLPMPDGTPGMFKCLVQKGYRPIVQEGHPDYYDGTFCGASFGGISMVNKCNVRG